MPIALPETVMLFAVCRRYIADNFEAEDLMMTAFMKIFSSLGSYSGQGSFEGWMRRITVNEALMHLRRSKTIWVQLEPEQGYLEPDYVLLENTLEEEDLLKMVQSLPDGYRAVFNLYAIEGYNHKEIGELLRISENTSKSQLSRARKQLQLMLLKAEEEIKNIPA